MTYGIHHQLPPAASQAPAVYNNPNLYFLGTSGYTNDGVEPDVGTSTTSFIFKVLYQSSNNNAPARSFPRLRIYKGGSEIAGSPFAMSYVSGIFTTQVLFINVQPVYQMQGLITAIHLKQLISIL